jgi:hypothetical protein
MIRKIEVDLMGFSGWLAGAYFVVVEPGIVLDCLRKLRLPYELRNTVV